VLAAFCASAVGCDDAPDARQGEPEVAWQVVTASDDPFVNRCAVDPIGDLERRIDPDPPYVLGYRSGKATTCAGSVAAPYIVGDPDDNHRQSIQRIHRGQSNYLLVSQSLPPGGEWSPGFEVIEMGAHGGDGGALGSGGVTPSSGPDCADHVVRYHQHPSPGRRHAGGIQASGRFAVVALEDSGDEVPAAFFTVDLADPAAPVDGPEVLRQSGSTTNGGAAGLARLADGRFLVMLFGRHSWEVEVFLSSDQRMPDSPVGWSSRGAWDAPFGLRAPKYQNVQLVTACGDGALYALASEQSDDGDELADLWRVSVDAATYRPTFHLAVRAVMECCTKNTGDLRFCDFDAGAGAYVDPTGHLILYGVESYNEFSAGAEDTGVAVREFPRR
jgi:hypothetical protein